MNKFGAIVACLILIIGLGGFAYAYMSKVNAYDQTKKDLVSLGYEISNNVSGIAVSTFIRSETVVPVVDFASFVSIARQNKVTTIYEQGTNFYVITILIVVVTAYEYAPVHSIWWIWG